MTNEFDSFESRDLIEGDIDFLSPEQKRFFVEKFYETGRPGKALAEALGQRYEPEHVDRAERLMEGDEFIRGLMAQAKNIVVNDLTAMKADSASILADLRERSMVMEKPNAAVMAEVARGKVLGLYIDPKERSAEVIKLMDSASMTDDQLESIIKQIRLLPNDIRRHFALMIWNPATDEDPNLIEGTVVSA